jgi:hypothetical protein
MRPSIPVLALILLTAAQANASFLCPRLTVSDASVLTEKQLAARVCSYMDTVDELAKLADTGTPQDRIRNADLRIECILAAGDTERLYAERFDGKHTGCLK